MEILSQCCEQARWAYKGAVFESKRRFVFGPLVMKNSARIPRQAKIILSLVLVATGGAATAQPNTVPCAIDIPVNVVVRDGRLIRGLKADQFVAQASHAPLRVVAATDDCGPRRILLVLETGGKVVQ